MAAAAEERFSRLKHDPRLPVEAFRYCLASAGLTVAGVDAVAYYESPRRKLARQLWCAALDASRSALDPRRPERLIRERLGFDGPLLTFAHHLSHAASALDFSGFAEAATLTADGVGEWATTSYGQGDAAGLEIFEEVSFPHSLGLVYSTVTSYLGFRVNGGEAKVMGLAAYGEPRYVDEICQLVGMGGGGQFLLNLRYFDFMRGARMYTEELCGLFGQPPRQPEAEIEPFHQDVARSLQLVLEEILLEKVAYLHDRTGSPNLCMAGGVALNCVAGGRIAREGPFERIFVQPAAGDAGACLGAAALAHRQLTGQRPAPEPLASVFLGPDYPPDDVARLLVAAGIAFEDYRERESDLVDAVAARLEACQTVGWFHGRMEHGPRALGGRSILANPLDPGARDRLNRRIKKREAFRPFAPSVLASEAAAHFDLDGPSPFMLEACEVTSPLALPGITHADGSSRPQTVDPQVCPRYGALIEAFRRRTGCPLVLNTSFNVRGEPIVCSPVDALFCFAASGLDGLALEDFFVEREALPPSLVEMLPVWQRTPGCSAISERLYTFV